MHTFTQGTPGRVFRGLKFLHGRVVGTMFSRNLPGNIILCPPTTEGENGQIFGVDPIGVGTYVVVMLSCGQDNL